MDPLWDLVKLVLVIVITYREHDGGGGDSISMMMVLRVYCPGVGVFVRFSILCL